MNRNNGGGGLKPSSLSVLCDLHEHLNAQLPSIPQDDPLRDQLVQLEGVLRLCRYRPEHPDPALSPAGALALRQPVT